jgi:hypothetical protein
MGDWVNLMSHQKAAYRILTELWEPESAIKHGAMRMAIKWYLHFDTLIGAFSAKPPMLPRSWIGALHAYYKSAVQNNPENITIQYEERWCYVRLLTFDAFSLMANQSTQSGEEWDYQVANLLEQFSQGEKDIPDLIRDPSYLLTDFSDCPPLDPDDIFNAHEPGALYVGELFPTNQLRLSYAAMNNVLRSRIANIKGVANNDDNGRALGYQILKTFNAIQYWSKKPPGALLQFRSVLPLGVMLNPPTNERELRSVLKAFQAIEAEG